MRTPPSLPRVASFLQAGFISLLAILAGCASPGDPVERKPQVYAAVTDLSASQAGNDVVLTFTIPKETVDRRAGTTAPSIEIYRSIHAPAAASSASPSAPALLLTVPSSMVATYVVDGRFRYADSLTSGDFLPNAPQSAASYSVRTRASIKRESADSNLAELNIYPAPLPISDLQAQASQSAINLTWSTPQATLTGSVAAITAYHVYRANAVSTPTAASAPAESAASASTQAASKLAAPLVEIGQSDSPQYSDRDAQAEKSYVYSVRSVIENAGTPLESADSNLAAITLHDVFPPGIPTQLIVTPVPAEAGTPAHIDLSWAISPETDLAGYNVYRSEQADAPGARVNSQLLPTPAYSDMSVMPGRTYYYTITAVDRTGNESGASSAVAGALPSAAGSQASP